MFLVCHVVSKDKQKVMWLYGWEPPMVSHHSTKFGDHRCCGSGDIFLVVEEKDSRSFRFNLPLLFITKGHGLTLHIILITPILVTRTHALGAIEEKYENNFALMSKTALERRKRKNGNCKAFCVKRKRKNVKNICWKWELLTRAQKKTSRANLLKKRSDALW